MFIGEFPPIPQKPTMSLSQSPKFGFARNSRKQDSTFDPKIENKRTVLFALNCKFKKGSTPRFRSIQDGESVESAGMRPASDLRAVVADIHRLPDSRHQIIRECMTTRPYRQPYSMLEKSAEFSSGLHIGNRAVKQFQRGGFFITSQSLYSVYF